MSTILESIDETLRHADKASQALQALRAMLTPASDLAERLGPSASANLTLAIPAIQSLINDLEAARRDELAGMFTD